MGLFARLFRLIWGGEVDRALRPVLAVSLSASLSASAGWTFMGIWAIRELGAEKSQLGIAFLVGAAMAAVSGYVGGHLSDRFGRRLLILVGSVSLLMVACACANQSRSFGSASLVPARDHEHAHTMMREDDA